MRRALAPLALLALAGQASADRIDDLVAKTLREQKVPGMTIAILKNGKPVKQKGYGLAEIENSVPAKLETVYELASVSKQFTAVATLMLVDEGKLSLDDPVSKFVPETSVAWEPMRIRHLLTHTSGLGEFHFRPDRVSALSFMRYTNDMQLEDIRRTRILFTPGTKFQYSNAGMELLGLIVGKVSGLPFPDFVRQRILAPAGMTQTRFKDGGEIVPNRAGGYTLRAGSLARWTLTQTLQSLDVDAFGGLLSNVGDLTKWENAIAAGRYLKPETWRLAWTPYTFPDGKVSRYGMGWSVESTKDGRRIWHTGHTGTFLMRLPDKGLTIIVLSNLGSGNPPPYGRDASWKLYEFAEAIQDLAVAQYGK
ncbi:MAG: serine hydrolase domain-containing protein [Fimbriimonas sp.]